MRIPKQCIEITLTTKYDIEKLECSGNTSKTKNWKENKTNCIYWFIQRWKHYRFKLAVDIKQLDAGKYCIIKWKKLKKWFKITFTWKWNW
jgi:hypothetical protein